MHFWRYVPLDVLYAYICTPTQERAWRFFKSEDSALAAFYNRNTIRRIIQVEVASSRELEACTRELLEVGTRV